MGSDPVVVRLPCFDLYTRLGERSEQHLVQELVPEAAVEANEFMDESLLEARLLLDEERFREVAGAIRSGAVTSASLDIFADLFEFAYEGALRGPGDKLTYAVLCEQGDYDRHGFTTARLEEIRLEWSSSLITSPGADWSEQTGNLEGDLSAAEQAVRRTVERSADVAGSGLSQSVFYVIGAIAVIALIRAVFG